MTRGETPVDGPGWSDIAGWYDTYVRSGRTPHELATRALLELAGDVTGRRVVDVACGQGLATRALARAGAASVVGVDVTEALLDVARAEETADPLGIAYLHGDAQRLDGVPDASADVVSCQLALMDIPDLDATLRAVSRVVAPGGVFVTVVGHPCFLAPFAQTAQADDGSPVRIVRQYLTEGFWRSPNPDGVRRVGQWSRTLSTYVNALVDAGFVVERLAEPRADGGLAQEQPVYREIAMLLGIRARLSG
jgi:ubiquinone/menaquinone biosynthesis C-methylase UbiE